MITNRLKPTQALVLIIGLVLFFCVACGSFNRNNDMRVHNKQIQDYYVLVRQGQYEEANKALDNNNALKGKWNRLLFLLEKGKNFHMLHQPDSSNYYFNAADEYIDQFRNNFGEYMRNLGLDQMSVQYRGEDFERFMIHYYKALNYVYKNQMEDAIVEARQITLLNQKQNDKFKGDTNCYFKDAFLINLQGMIYEAAGDINNAFIAYRNAFEVYSCNSGSSYFGVPLAEQLKRDVIRTAYLNGFRSELDYYEQKFNMHYQPVNSEGGELILFWENGFVPLKDKQVYFYELVRRVEREGVRYYLIDNSRGVVIPYFGAPKNIDEIDFNYFKSIRVTFPKYLPNPPYYLGANAAINDTTIPLEQIENINTIANTLMDKRLNEEMAPAIRSQTSNRIFEYLEKKKKRDQDTSKAAKLIPIRLSETIQIVDTRSWTTLPSSVYYARIPLQRGKNTILLKTRTIAGQDDVYTINVEGIGRLVLYNYATLK